MTQTANQNDTVLVCEGVLRYRQLAHSANQQISRVGFKPQPQHDVELGGIEPPSMNLSLSFATTIPKFRLCGHLGVGSPHHLVFARSQAVFAARHPSFRTSISTSVARLW